MTFKLAVLSQLLSVFNFLVYYFFVLVGTGIWFHTDWFNIRNCFSQLVVSSHIFHFQNSDLPITF